MDYNKEQKEHRPSNERIFTVSSRRAGISIRKKGYVSPVGGYIHDAKTNETYGVRVGSKGEERFFKVAICDGSIGEDHMLFFSSPEDCESFFEFSLRVPDKKSWVQRTTANPKRVQAV